VPKETNLNSLSFSFSSSSYMQTDYWNKIPHNLKPLGRILLSHKSV
jgi:hypothetical protein